MARGAACAVLLLLAAAVLAAEAAADDGTTHLSFFMHDTVSGSSPTAVQVIKGPAGSSSPSAASLGMSFGDTMVFDDPLTETSSGTSKEVGRMQGTYMSSSQSGGAAVLMVCGNLLLTSGAYNGSTIAVLGRDDTGQAVRELPVVGGTGKFRMAEGYVLWKTSGMKGPDATVQIDVYLTTAGGNATTIDAAAPVSPADGSGAAAGGGSSSSGSGAKPSSAAAMTVVHGGWAHAAGAVVALVVGSWLW